MLINHDISISKSKYEVAKIGQGKYLSRGSYKYISRLSIYLLLLGGVRTRSAAVFLVVFFWAPKMVSQ